MYPHTITLVNTFNNRGRVEKFETIISGVLYQDTQKVISGTQERLSDTQGYVQIPSSYVASKPYLSPSEWKSKDDKDNYWTLQTNEDYILKGEHFEIDISNSSARLIVGVEDIDYGITIPQHYGIYLK